MFYGVRGPRARIPRWFTANYHPGRIALRLPVENRPVNDLSVGRGRTVSQKSTTQRRVARARVSRRVTSRMYPTSCTRSRPVVAKDPAATSRLHVPTKLLFLHRGAKMFTALARRGYERREGGEGGGGGTRCSTLVSYDWAKRSRLLRRELRPVPRGYLPTYLPQILFFATMAHTSCR